MPAIRAAESWIKMVSDQLARRGFTTPPSWTVHVETNWPDSRIVESVDDLRASRVLGAPSTVICDFSGIVGLIHWSARS